ncbi:MAG: pirin family protein [Vicingaceae bacterium]
MSKDLILSIQPLGFQWQTQDPFIFCVHHDDHFPKGNEKMGPDASLEGRNIGQDFTVKDGWRMYHGDKIPGFPYHPNAGFETVTICVKGFIDHSDSLGATGRFGKGDVQWMTAGKGVQHSEMFPLLNRDKDNPLELFQIWLNLPRAAKKVEAHFKMLWSEDIPVVKETNDQGKVTEINVICGNFRKAGAPSPTPDSWAADPLNELAIWTIKLEAGASLKLPKSQNEVNRALYFYRGSNLKVENQRISDYHEVRLISDAEVALEAENEDCYVLLLQGKAIDEPVAQYGPFVGNYQGDIREIMLEYQRTEFGGWPWSSKDPVHSREKGRFARHADGREEVK